MLQSDMALMAVPEFQKWVMVYAQSVDQFFADFTSAFAKLQENGQSTLLPHIKW